MRRKAEFKTQAQKRGIPPARLISSGTPTATSSKLQGIRMQDSPTDPSSKPFPAMRRIRANIGKS